MLRKLKRYQTIGIIFVAISGVLLHFLYEWTDNNFIIGVFCPVNESVWEHLKLLFIPYLIYTFFQLFVLSEHFPNVIYSNTIGVLLGMASIIVIFYTYSGIIGKSIALLDILIFMGSVYLSFLISSIMMKNRYGRNTYCQLIGMIILILLFASFIIFTYYPIHINLFRDPVTGIYGLKQ